MDENKKIARRIKKAKLTKNVKLISKILPIIIGVIWLVFSIIMVVMLSDKYTDIYLFGLLFGKAAFIAFAGIVLLVLLFFSFKSDDSSQARYIVLFVGVLWIVFGILFCSDDLKNTFTEHKNTKRYTISLPDGKEVLFYEETAEDENTIASIEFYKKDLFLVRKLGSFGTSFTDNGSKLPEYSYNEETKEITFIPPEEFYEEYDDPESIADFLTFSLD
ncbi:DUF308 domain-containing protein [Ruminococcus sp. XPD3002]|uniref:DUF308 domain-containing protein n=1 Tax=Ruminococcus sp. XPD3002 TaxID=1452269 RepID=UPI00091E3EDF|nr:hypothetical protein SAMN04487832_1332 [Ruminococcus flavefaciens]